MFSRYSYCIVKSCETDVIYSALNEFIVAFSNFLRDETKLNCFNFQ